MAIRVRHVARRHFTLVPSVAVSLVESNQTLWLERQSAE